MAFGGRVGVGLCRWLGWLVAVDSAGMKEAGSCGQASRLWWGVVSR